MKKDTIILVFLIWAYKARTIDNKAQITVTTIDLLVGNYVTFLPQYPIWEDVDVSASRRLVPPDRVKAKYFWKCDVVSELLEASAVSLLSSILQGSMLVNASLDMQILEITFWNTVNNSDINPNSINSAKTNPPFQGYNLDKSTRISQWKHFEKHSF